VLRLSTLVEKAFDNASDGYRFKQCLKELISILEFEDRRRSGRKIVELRAKRFVVLGDVHGDLDTMVKLLERTHAISIAASDGCVVMLGDYVDRGPRQPEVLALICELKRLLGERLVLLRGNHECPPWLPVYPHDYPYVLRYRYGHALGEELYELSRQFFELLPLVAIAKGMFVAVHGGPPVKRVVEAKNVSELLDIENDYEAIEDILWSDPVDDNELPNPSLGFALSYRGAGKVWGSTITTKFLSLMNAKMIVRGHEPCYLGYKLDHGGRVLTVFSMKGYYGNAAAGAVVIDDKCLESIERCIVTT